jgi:hypothetical protein
MGFLVAVALGIVAVAFLIWAPALFLGPKGQKRYVLALIIALAVPFAVFAYALDGYTGIGLVALVAGLFIIANTST